MKEEIAKKWVEALRSGKYEQGKMALKNDNRYCCLGVLQGPVLNLEIEYGSGYLSDQAVIIAGMKSRSGKDSTGMSLSTMNDCCDKSFIQIADHIEKHWQEL